MKHGQSARRGIWIGVVIGGVVLSGGAYAIADASGGGSAHGGRTSAHPQAAAALTPFPQDTPQASVSPTRSRTPKPHPTHKKPRSSSSPKGSPGSSGGNSGGQRSGGGSAPQGGTATRYAQQVVALVNDQRSQNGCGPLTVNSRLMLAAQRHTDDMVNRHFFDHTNPDGQSPGDRITAAGYRWSTWGENIAAGQQTPADVMDAWMHSPGHRANILNCSFREIGVGVNLNSGTPYWTQDFGAP